MSLFRCKRPLSVLNAGFNLSAERFADRRMIEAGDVVDGRPVCGWINLDNWSEHFKELPDPRDRPVPKSRADLQDECDRLDEWMQTEHLLWSAQWSYPIIDAQRVVTQRLEQLSEAAEKLGFSEPLDIDGPDQRKARRALNKLREFAADSNGSPEAKSGEQPAEPTTPGMTWQEAAERLERLRTQGEPFTSQPRLAHDFGCSSGTINKAIRNTPSLQSWAGVAENRVEAAPKAQSLNSVVTDRVAQSREPDPTEEIIRQEYIERCSPEEREWFLKLPMDTQIEVANDPDSTHGQLNRRILGRKP